MKGRKEKSILFMDEDGHWKRRMAVAAKKHVTIFDRKAAPPRESKKPKK